VTVEAARWSQTVVVAPHDTAAWCAALTRRALVEVEAFLSAPWSLSPVRTVLCSATAGLLPGLAAALESRLGAGAASAGLATDFGAGLLDDEEDCPRVEVLPRGAAALSAHALAESFHRGDLPAGHLDAAAPLRQPA
jgi:hypothetical protein